MIRWRRLERAWVKVEFNHCFSGKILIWFYSVVDTSIALPCQVPKGPTFLLGGLQVPWDIVCWVDHRRQVQL